jgi:hypothetical protein
MYFKTFKSSYPNSTQLQLGHVVDAGSDSLHQWFLILNLSFKWPVVCILQGRYRLQYYFIMCCCIDNTPPTKLAWRFAQKFRSIQLTTCLSIMSHIYSLAYVIKVTVMRTILLFVCKVRKSAETFRYHRCLKCEREGIFVSYIASLSFGIVACILLFFGSLLKQTWLWHTCFRNQLTCQAVYAPF